MPDREERVAAIVDRYYGHLLRAGEQGLSLDPLVELTAPAQGQVLWSAGQALEGYMVSKADWDGMFPGLRGGFERMGFSPAMLQDGLWVLMGVRYPRSGPAERVGSSHAFAHYDPVGGTWTVVRGRPGVPQSAGWASQWLPAGQQLGGEEKSVVARIADETAMLADAAVTLQDDLLAYTRAEHCLMLRASRSRDPRDALRMAAVLRPDAAELPGPAAGGRFRVSAFGRLSDLAVPLYRALAGKPQRDSSGLIAVATVSEATLCPPHEPGGFELSRGVRSRPAAPRPRPPPAAGEPGPGPEAGQ